MRILLVAHKLGPGGTERAVQNCALAYRDRGHESAVLAYYEGGYREEILRARGVSIFKGGHSDPERREATKEAARWQPDIVHMHRPGHANPVTDAILRQLNDARGRRLPVVETSHFSRADRSEGRALIDVHIHMTRWCMWKWQRWARGLKPRPIGVVVPHLVDVNAFRPVDAEVRRAFRAELDIPEEAFVFGRLGQPNAGSWSPIAVRAFGDVAASDLRAHLLLVGAPQVIVDEVQQLPEPIRSRAVVHPFVHGDEQLRACYSSLDSFLHASALGESFGFVLLEAALCGAAPITLSRPARGNSQVEVVDHLRGGLVVNDRRSMVDAMHLMMNDDALRQRLVRNGQVRIHTEYAWDVVADQHVRLLELVQTASSREDIQRRLAQDGRFVTGVENREIYELLHRGIGRPGLRDRVLLQLGHQPTLYAAFRRFKRWRRRAAAV